MSLLQPTSNAVELCRNYEYRPPHHEPSSLAKFADFSFFTFFHFLHVLMVTYIL